MAEFARPQRERLTMTHQNAGRLNGEVEVPGEDDPSYE